MDHPLQLASEVAGLSYQVTDAPKQVTYSAPTILPNVQIYYMLYQTGNNAPWAWGFLRDNQKTVTDRWQANGHINLYGMLLPQIHPVQIVNGHPSYVIDIGVGDGTGADFDGVMGARITLTFIPPTATNVAPYRGAPVTVTNTVTDYLKQEGYLLDINNAAFGGNASNYQAIQVQVDADDHNKAMIEQMVWIHLFDGNGNLLGVIDTLDHTVVNNNVNIDIRNGFQMMALIQGNATNSNNFAFSIGDPKTDATVSIMEI